MSSAALTPPRHAGWALRALRRALTRLPRGRARAARALSRVLSAPFIDAVEPRHLGVRLVVNPADPFQLEIWLGAYQPHVVHFLRKTVRAGSRVLCAGLHVGYVAALARRLAGPTGLVLSAEPDPIARDWAERNLRLTDGSTSAPVAVLPSGLAAADGQLRLFESAVMGHSSFASPHQQAGELTVSVRRGDDWLASVGVDSLDVLVLDVEGWELEVLRGLERTIAGSPGLRALVEVCDWALRDAGASPGALVSWWRQRGFAVRWAERSGPGLEHGVWGAEVERGSPLALRATDVLCVRER